MLKSAIAAATAVCLLSPLPVSPRARKRNTGSSAADGGITICPIWGLHPVDSPEPKPKAVDAIASRRITLSMHLRILKGFLNPTFITLSPPF
jgi:hypothetical protein